MNEQIRCVNASLCVGAREYPLFCECSRTECVEQVAVPAAIYEDLRSTARRFVVSWEHVGRERVVGRDGVYRVVEATARRSAPRHAPRLPPCQSSR